MSALCEHTPPDHISNIYNMLHVGITLIHIIALTIDCDCGLWEAHEVGQAHGLVRFNYVISNLQVGGRLEGYNYRVIYNIFSIHLQTLLNIIVTL